MAVFSRLFRIYVNSIWCWEQDSQKKKLQNMKKTISIAETKHLSASGLFSKAIENNSISDIEFNSILRLSSINR